MNLSELVIEPVRREDEARFLALMRQHHYLGAPHKIGESAFYAAVYQGEWVALSSFYAAAERRSHRLNQPKPGRIHGFMPRVEYTWI